MHELERFIPEKMDKIAACVVRLRVLKSWSNRWIGLTSPSLKLLGEGFESRLLFGALFSRQE